MRTPATIAFAELVETADRAAKKADEQARAAGIRVAGLEKKRNKAKPVRIQTQKTQKTA